MGHSYSLALCSLQVTLVLSLGQALRQPEVPNGEERELETLISVCCQTNGSRRPGVSGSANSACVGSFGGSITAGQSARDCSEM